MLAVPGAGSKSLLSRIRRCVGHPPWLRSFRGPRRCWQGRSGTKMAAAAELGALGRRWLCWLLGLQAVRADPVPSRSRLSAAAARETRSGCEGGEGSVIHVPGREARASARRLLLRPWPPVLLSMSEIGLYFCPLPKIVLVLPFFNTVNYLVCKESNSVA